VDPLIITQDRMKDIPASLVIQGDARVALPKLPDESVQCVVTSPPYWSLRDYHIAGQIGLELTVDQFINRLVGVFTEVRRVLKDDGVVAAAYGPLIPSTCLRKPFRSPPSDRNYAVVAMLA